MGNAMQGGDVPVTGGWSRVWGGGGGGGTRWSVHGHGLGITSAWGRKADTFVGSSPEDHLAPNFEAFFFLSKIYIYQDYFRYTLFILKLLLWLTFLVMFNNLSLRRQSEVDESQLKFFHRICHMSQFHTQAIFLFKNMMSTLTNRW
jgi:hypothetical protein